MDDWTIFISYSNTGGGHRYAAEAIRTAIEELVQGTADGPNIKVIAETSIENTNRLNDLFVDLYNYLLRHHPSWMKYYIGFIEAVKPNDSWLGYILCRAAVKESLKRIQPAVVVSVHPMVNHYTARAMKELGIADKTKLVIVVTDPNDHLWSGWACKDAALIFAPNDMARDRLIELGIDQSRIRMFGMPIETKYTRPARVGRREFLRLLNLEPERPTILLSGGWAGCGGILDTYRALQRVQKPIQVIVLCGHNQQLLAEMNLAKEASSIPTAVLGFTESLSSLMNACDLMVTKGGGLTTFEAIARRLPMALDLLTPPMPQEKGTVKMLIDAKLAKPLRESEDIVSMVEKLEHIHNREMQELPTAHNLDQVDAIYDIVETIMDLLPQELSPEVRIADAVSS